MELYAFNLAALPVGVPQPACIVVHAMAHYAAHMAMELAEERSARIEPILFKLTITTPPCTWQPLELQKHMAKSQKAWLVYQTAESLSLASQAGQL